MDHLFLALMDSTQANGQPLGSSQTDRGGETHGVPEIFKEVKMDAGHHEWRYPLRLLEPVKETPEK